MRTSFLIVFLLVAVLGCKNKTASVTAASDTYYTCSMDPQVKEHKPGKCPICKMDLTPVKKKNGNSHDEIELSEQQVQLGNIHADTIQNGTIGDKLVLTATLNFDQMKASSVSARVMGRVEKLYYKNVGDFVKKGAPLYELYSEELNNAKQEYLLALERKKVFVNETMMNFDQLLQSARNKLLLWGMSDKQVQELAQQKKASTTTTFYSPVSGTITSLETREGDYVMEGGVSQMADINRNSIATVQFPDFDGLEIRGTIGFVNPEINPDTRINLIRVAIPNSGNQLKPGMSAYVLLKSAPRKTLTLPIDAVIRDGNGATVWVRTGKKTFKTLMVETGLETDDRIEIRSGLRSGDVVVVSGAYLLQSEYIFQKGANPMAGHDMSKM